MLCLAVMRLIDGATVAFLAAAFAATLPAPDRQAVPAVESRPHACHVPGVPDEVLCATYPVWEDREKKAGRKIGLNIVILPALEKVHAPDPIFYLDGGPGAGATRLAPGLAGFRAIRNKRDLVLVDQRGTGGSNPLDCSLYGDPPDPRKLLAGSFPLQPIRECRKRLEKIADLRLYTTAPGMDDVNEVRQWLGYQRINVWGGSYGTVSAQVYVRRHGDTVRALALQAVAPVDELNPLHHAWAGQRAVDAIFDKCSADADCRAAYPRVREEFNALVERVRIGIDVEVNDGHGGRVRVKPSLSGFAESVRHFLYYDDGRSFPAMIHRAAGGDLSELLEKGLQAERQLGNLLSLGMLLSVTCAETVPYITDAMVARDTARTFLGDLRVREQQAACKEWVRGPVPPDVHRLVQSDVPALIFSGARDPVTPPDFGARVAAGFRNGLHVVFPESSHGNWGSCGNTIYADFIDRGSVEGLDVSCVAGQKAVKFLIR